MMEKRSERTLSIQFDDYVDNDPVFKKELIELMITNLFELQQALIISLQLDDLSVYRSACHKMSSTLTMLADQELTELAEHLKTNPVSTSVAGFQRICAVTTENLRGQLLMMETNGSN